MYKIIMRILFFVFAAEFASFAQSEIPLEDVLVSAYKMDIPIGQSTAAYVLTHKELEQNGYAFVVDALQSVPGIAITQNGALGGTASVFIRGAKTGNMVVLIDGVKINDPSTIERTFDFGTLLTDAIDRIEIIKGPQSVLYGSDATGGVINIVTKRGHGKPTFTVEASGGSFSTSHLSARVAGTSNGLDYSLTVGQISSQGYSKAAKPDYATKPFDDDGFYQQFAMGRFGFAQSRGLSFEFGFSTRKTDLAIDDGAFVDDPTSFENRKEISSFARSIHQLTEFWKHSISLDYSFIKRSYNDFDDDGDSGFVDFGSDNYYVGSNAHGEWVHTVVMKDVNTLLFGTAYEREQYKYHDEILETERKNDAFNVGFFVQDHIHIEKLLYVTLGIRSDRHEMFRWHQSYNASCMVVIPGVKTKLKGNWGRGYKAPSLYQIYGDGGTYVLENKGLKPEENTGFDVGIEQPLFNIAVLQAGYFQNKYKNMVDVTSQPQYKYKYENIGNVKTNGIEATATVKPFDFLNFTGGYTYLKAIDEDKDERLLRRPTHHAYANVALLFQKVNISVTGTYVGNRNDAYYDSLTFNTIKVTNEKYFKYDLAMQYAVTEKLTLTAKAENITNEKYQQVVGYEMPQRSFFVGLKGIF
ncbi:MAG: TonB-dependent receptor [Spirochaetes bacterium]|nr:TonB-dependent receptor [Spirochaetota bacterium]